jgi:hypothetical protein
VRWQRVKNPKCLGGLGILDLECFSRALRLRWLWYEWVEPDRPWVGTEVPCSEIDRQLFRASTVVTIGDGRKASFWKSPWLDGITPRDMAPNLFKLAWCKKNYVADDLHNQRWTRGLWRMNTVDKMAEFMLLWDKLQSAELTETQDTIVWRWTANGMYSSKSAYRVQFRGSYCSFNSRAIWSATSEGKHKIFLWFLIQNKVLTADHLLVRNWPCDPACILCDQAWETAAHLCLHCVYAREVWYLVSYWAEGMIQVPLQEVSTEQWWNGSVQGRPKHISRRLASILMCTAWNIWKEQNRRIFQGLFTTPTQIFRMIKDELLVREVALGGRRSAAPS